MPPASETTSGRLATANSARISDAVIPAVRAANRSVGRPDGGTAGRDAPAAAAAPVAADTVLDGDGGVAGCGTVDLPDPL